MVTLVMISAGALAQADDPDRIQPYTANPFYWQYKGKPVLLLGGSDSDALFNKVTGLQPGNTTLEQHLDLLVSVGGNYVRGAMTWRKEWDAFPYVRLANGLYDLNQPNPEYWNRFENFLNMTAARDIIVQVDVWDQHNFARKEEYQGGWNLSPFNPANNVNYTAQESNFPTDSKTVSNENVNNIFFATVPALANNTMVLPYQQAFVDKMLSYTLKHRHVLYHIGNECHLALAHISTYGEGKGHAWADYWAGYIQGKAAESGKQVETTDMVSQWAWGAPLPYNGWLADRPELYVFLDISQINDINNQHGYDGKGWADWDNTQRNDIQYKRILDFRQRLKNHRKSDP